MGISTDAKLFYGVLVSDRENGVDEVASAKALGFIDESVEEFGDGESIADFDLPAGLEWAFTGHCEGCPGVYAVAKGGLTAYRGGDIKVRALPKVSDAQRKKLDEIAEKLGAKAGYFLAPSTDF
jgi:hypothetical protein